MLRADALEVGFRGRPLLPPTSFVAAPGELWAIVGPNGCGKTTLLRTLVGLLPPVSGRVSSDPGTRVGYVPQRSAIDLSVPARSLDVIAGGVDRGWSFLNPLHRFRQRRSVTRAARDVDAAKLAREPFRRLSEGQKQRVLIGRALASDPEVLVLDEPTAAMDVRAEQRLLELVDELRTVRRVAVIVVSHQLAQVAAHASHLVVLERDQQWVSSGPLDEVAADDRVTALFGNLLLGGVARPGGAT